MSETWVAVEGYEGHYEVSDLGRVRSLDRSIVRSRGTKRQRQAGRVLQAAKDGGGYLFVTLCKDGEHKSTKVHHIVARAFLVPSEKPQINHKDFDRQNNSASNLEWVTAQENMRHQLVAVPGLSGAEAAARMEAVYVAKRAAKPGIRRHPKEKICLICGDLYTPRPTARERAKTCSPTCGYALRWQTRRSNA